MKITPALKAEAFRQGFALCGVTTPEPPPHWSVFQHWLDLGRNASMEYLHDPRRADPRLVLPECKSILVLAARYPGPVPGDKQTDSSPTGRIASYARGQDYHDVLIPSLKALVAFLEKLVDHPVASRVYTDTGPILERDLAQRAGLGWIGKNTCLINPKIGSYFFLAEILLGIELDADPAFRADRCGSCTRCLDACPTGCILPDRTIDARRCISFLTIENKGIVPEELRTAMGDWVFGCDLCQMVCPWNRHADPQPAPLPAFLPDPKVDVAWTDLGLTPYGFNTKFRNSPIQRARRKGYLRNLAIALGNVGEESILPLLQKVVITETEDELVRQHAVWAMGQISKKG